MKNPTGARPFVRFVARWFDYVLVLAILDVCGMDKLHFHPYLKSIVAAVVWIPVEAFLLGKWGTSPGKWILRTTVDPLEGPRPQWWKALDRSFTVFTFGLACFIPFVSWVAGVASLKDLQETGTTRWDRKKYCVTHGSISVIRYCLFIFLGLAAFLIPLMRRLS